MVVTSRFPKARPYSRLRTPRLVRISGCRSQTPAIFPPRQKPAAACPAAARARIDCLPAASDHGPFQHAFVAFDAVEVERAEVQATVLAIGQPLADASAHGGRLLQAVT